MRLSLWLFWICIAGFPFTVLRAQEQQESIPNNTFVDQTHKRLSSSLFYLSNRLDSFFGGERADDLPNGSRVRLIWTFNQEEGTTLKGEAAVRVNIALVETQKKLKVSFKNKYEKQHEDNPSPPSPQEPQAQLLEQTAEPLPYDIRDLLRWRLKVDSGVRIDFPPDPFARLSILKSWEVGLWELRPSQQVFWFLKNGLGETTRLDLDRPINENLLFRFENDATWTNNSDEFIFFTGPNLLQQLSDKRGISYSAKVLGQSRPVWFVNDYRFDLSYRQRLFRDWFFAEFNPYVHYPKKREWKRTLGFNLHFEVVVGSY